MHRPTAATNTTTSTSVVLSLLLLLRLLFSAYLPVFCEAWYTSHHRTKRQQVRWIAASNTRLYETTLSTDTADTTTSITSNNIINNATIMTTPTVVTNALLHRAVGKLRPETTAMLLCDVQERFRPLLYHGETVIQTCRYLTSVAHELQMPVIATQQYTKVFGPTIAECFANEDIQKAAMPVFDKKKFSMLTPEVMEHLQTTELWKDRTSFVLFGIETHVCVQQTALDLLEQGKEVHIIVDGVTSQQALDRQVALTRLQQVGAYLTTAQSAVFMLMQSADHPNFKAISQLTVAHMKLVNEFNQDAMGAVNQNSQL